MADLITPEIPTSVAGGSGSYTIPAGYYGRVTAQVRNGGSFSIGGTTVLSSSNPSWNTINSLNSPRTVTATGVDASLSTYSSGTSGSGYSNVGAAFGNSTGQATDSAAGTYRLPAGTTINTSGNAQYAVELYPM